MKTVTSFTKVQKMLNWGDKNIMLFNFEVCFYSLLTLSCGSNLMVPHSQFSSSSISRLFSDHASLLSSSCKCIGFVKLQNLQYFLQKINQEYLHLTKHTSYQSKMICTVYS